MTGHDGLASEAGIDAADDPVAEVKDLFVTFRTVAAVRGVSFTVRRGECVAIVGESGSGKSVTARTLFGLTGDGARVDTTVLRICGQDARTFGERQWRAVRARLGYVLQDALVSLDPLRPVGKEIAEPLRLHGMVPRAQVAARTVELLREVGVPEPDARAAQYPHQLSGGLRQRALIASAIACDPELLVADEPTTALDVSVQAQILRLLDERRRARTAMLLICHDLAVVARIADRLLVMKDGRFVEEGPTERVLGAPSHPYTQALLTAIPGRRTRGVWLSVPPPSAGPPAARREGKVVLEARGLVKRFGARLAVDGVSFHLREGQTLGLVGESGSGKTTIARLVLGLVAPDRGAALIDGTSWTELRGRRRRDVRRHIQLVPQDPLSSFDPRSDVRRILYEALLVGGVPRARRRDRALELLEQVGLDTAVLNRHPARLSGGQRQRVAIARALAPGPRVLVCDEPVSALDVSVQAQVLDLLVRLQAENGLAYLFISHHLGVIHHMSDHVMVLKDGRVVESGEVGRIFTAPRADHTRELLAAIPTTHVAADAHVLGHDPSFTKEATS
ncbi:ABC transporter ATP-binding protein [Nonomuraea sp. NPDC046802]|uniref:ABC transporter ATP-binding protein n=1 Tax=Nonomuraea sp. NPDC046802 TaxID=3154919 RepID=UPI0033F767F9